MAIEITSSLLGDASLESIAGELEIELNTELRRVATNLIASLAFDTPKREGWATGEWQVGINDKPTTRTFRKDLTGATVITEETAVIDTAVNYKFPTIWVTNLAPYIERLNEGYSKLAPAKFIERALLRAEKAA